MSFFFIRFDKFENTPDFVVQGSSPCEMRDLVDAINARRIDSLSICEMHNHSDDYLNIGECGSLSVADGSTIKLKAIIRKPNTITKIQEGVLTGFSIRFHSEQKRITDIAVIDAPTFQDEELETFYGAIARRRLLYLWTLRARSVQVDDKEIRKLEAKIYPILREFETKDKRPLSQRDVDELQVLLASVEPESFGSRSSFRKALLFRLKATTVRMRKENNHQRPHFHIDYKNQYHASYAVDTFEQLADDIPARYAKPMLRWARQHQRELIYTWGQLKAGKDIRELVAPPEEV